MNYLSNDELEHYWFQYKAEYEPHGISLEQFCNTQKISYRAMDNWSRQIRSKVVPVEVEGVPSDKSDKKEGEGSERRDSDARYRSCKYRNGQTKSTSPTAPRSKEHNEQSSSVRILVSIKATNGLSIYQKNLSYEGLKLLVERLEGLC